MSRLKTAEIALLREVRWQSDRIGLLEDYLAFRAAAPVCTVEVAERFADGSCDVLFSLSAMLSRIDPAHGDLPVLYAAAGRMRRAVAKPSEGPGKGRRPIVSVPLEDVPVEWLDRVRGWRGAAKRRREMVYTLRQILGAARRAGLPERLDRPALAAFREELDARGVRPATIEFKMTDCGHLGRLFHLDGALLDLVRVEHLAAKKATAEQPLKRHADFRAAPISPLDYARAARRAAEEARACTGGRQTRHRLFLIAGALALLSHLPERIGDILKLTVGREVIRTPQGWRSDYVSGKTGQDRNVTLLPEDLTPYFDDLILLGADPGLEGEVLDRLYRQRAAMRSPLFARIDLQRTYSANRVFEWIKARTGHGPHAARKAMADYVAEIGAPAEDVSALLGHSSPAAARESYEINAAKIRRGHAQSRLAGARRDLHAGAETFRTPAGRLVDIERINGELARETSKREGTTAPRGGRGRGGT